MIYKITKIQKKTTSTGKEKADITIADVSGHSKDGVTIWSDFPNFAGLVVGSEIEGEYSEKQNGNYLNKVLYPPRQAKAGGGYGAGAAKDRAASIQKAQESKAEYVQKAQENKEESIKISSTFRDATMITIELCKKDGTLEFKDTWLLTRKWLLANWEPKVPVVLPGMKIEYPADQIDPKDVPF